MLKVIALRFIRERKVDSETISAIQLVNINEICYERKMLQMKEVFEEQLDRKE